MWKQPTPTDGLYNPNLNELDWMVFLYAWNMVRREDGIYEFFHGNNFFSIELKRGQCVFKVSKIAEILKIDRKRVRKSIKKLQKWYTEMDIEEKPYGLILTFKRADGMLKMDNETNSRRTVEGQREDSGGTTSKKNVKNVKKEKNVKNILSKDNRKTPDPRINNLINFLQEKIGGLDNSVTDNRRYCYLLLNKFTKEFPDKDPVDGIQAVIELGLQDNFHAKNLTSFRYVFYNFRKIINTYQTKKSNVIFIS